MVDGQLLAVAGAKGGVGKTTTAINLGAEFAAAGFETAVVEFDLAMANLVDFLDLDVDPTADHTLHDVLAAEASIAEASYAAADSLDAVPSGTTLEGYAGTDLDRLPTLVPDLRRRYDFVLFDTPAGASRELVEPLRLAGGMLLVSTPRVSAIRNAENTLELADLVGTDPRGLVLTKSGTGASPGAETLADFLDIDLLGHVPESPAIPHSQDQGQPVVAFAPETDAARAYRRIAGELAPGGWIFPTPPDEPVEADETLPGRLGGATDDDRADGVPRVGGDPTAPTPDDSDSTAADADAAPLAEDGGTPAQTAGVELNSTDGEAAADVSSPAGGESADPDADDAADGPGDSRADGERADPGAGSTLDALGATLRSLFR